MSYKTILVQAKPDEAGARALALAKVVARMFGACIEGVAAAGFDDRVYGDAAVELITAEQTLVDGQIAASRDRFLALTKDGTCGARCVSSTDFPLDVMKRHARGADLIVASRPSAHGSAGFDCQPADLVMETGLPVLLAADGSAELKAEHVLVAWRDQREAIRAISDALPFLMQAHSVHVVSICPADHEGSARAGLLEVKQRLLRHGVAAETEILAPTGAATADIEAAADGRHADLIVAGAYGHNRLREWAFGGVTQDLLAGSTKFVLLSR